MWADLGHPPAQTFVVSLRATCLRVIHRGLCAGHLPGEKQTSEVKTPLK
jgi:hypothetical protein